MRIAVDVGGTFTDFAVRHDTGEVVQFKVPSSPDRPGSALEEGLETIAASSGLAVRDLLESTELVIHGTTVATNALIQHHGARTALLCTQGFRDTLEIRLGHKESRYDPLLRPPPMLVERPLRLPVRERITKRGEVLVPLDEASVLKCVDVLAREGVEAVAVCFLWSFLNPAHERRVGLLLAENLPSVYVCLSCDVLPRIGEYDRTSTTVLNAYLGPLLRRYSAETEQLLADRGFRGRVHYMQANAGLASGKVLAKRPIQALHSGPAAAPTAAAFFGRLLGRDRVISIDMGGTSFDVCTVVDGLPEMVTRSDINRYRVAVPMVRLHAIGAGGGSIATVDAERILRVGPLSAESSPGPACYGLGGVQPTVTDANVVLGYLDLAVRLGGRIELDGEAARAAIETKVAAPLGKSVEEASLGILEVVNHNMANGIREVSVERGNDPRDFVLLSGGGAAGMHVGRLAMELGIGEVIVPTIASTLCAFGELVAELRHDYTSSLVSPLSQLDLPRLNGVLAVLEAQARDDLSSEQGEQLQFSRWAEMRYVGQLHECSVGLPPGELDDAALVATEELFHKTHEGLFGYSERESPCEVVNVGVTGRSTRADDEEVWTAGGSSGEADGGRAPTRRAFFPEAGGFVDTPIYTRGNLGDGKVVAGPAIVDEENTTIVVVPGCDLRLDKRGWYLMRVLNRDAAVVREPALIEASTTA